MWDNPMVRDDEWPFLAIVTDVVYNFEANLGIQKAPTRKWVEVSQHYRPFPDAAINKDVGWTFAFGSCEAGEATVEQPSQHRGDLVLHGRGSRPSSIRGRSRRFYADGGTRLAFLGSVHKTIVFSLRTTLS